jgi:hypothetical protein
MTPAEVEQLVKQARAGESDLERKLAASVLLAARVFPLPVTTTTPAAIPTTAGAGAAMQFRKATKRQAKLRLTLDGPSGSGKTYSALVLSKCLGGRVAVIDTERGSASKYADRFEFDALELEEFSLETYMKAIEAAKREGYDVLIIDSLSHAWSGKGGALETVDRVGGSNKFSGWRQVTPLHNRLVDAILAFPGHVICTMRTKTEWVVEQNEKGKSAPRKVGLAPVQRDGMEYEFDVVADLSAEGWLTISKTRCPDLSGSAGLLSREQVGEVGEKLKAWLSDGASPVLAPAPQPTPPAANANAEPKAISAVAPAPQSTGAQPSPVEQALALVAEAQAVADLDKLVTRIQALTKQEQSLVRAPFMKRRHELARGGKGAGNVAQR